MKLSYYNNYLSVSGHCLIYNSFTDKYILIKKELKDLIDKNINNLESISNSNPVFYEDLLNYGMLIRNHRDEIEEVKNERMKRRFSSDIYHLTLNTTMDCNLNCWYCYENHSKGAVMDKDMIDLVHKHLDYKLRTEPFRKLIVSFFGGEPLLNSKDVFIPMIRVVKDFVKSNNIRLTVLITTNGTIITESILKELEDVEVNFQFTVDGIKNTHNSIRKYKTTELGSYDMIVKNIKRLVNTLSTYHIILRINFDAKTIKDIHGIIPDLSFVDYKDITFSLQKIWQEDYNKINFEDIFRSINIFREMGYVAEFADLALKDHACYADNYNQAVINFDGKIYKCTARDFNEDNSEGYINDIGKVIWKTEKIGKRMATKVPEMCEECKIFPTCQGFCTQNYLESEGKDLECILYSMGVTVEEHIFRNFEKNLRFS